MKTDQQRYQHVFSHFTRLKRCTVTCDATKIVMIEWGGSEKNLPNLASTKLPIAQILKRWFAAYEKGDVKQLSAEAKDIGYELSGTPFQVLVWNAIAQIPIGQTLSYGALALKIGKPKAFRAVGAACGKNPLPIFIPCHRVVAATGIGGFSGNLAVKKELLAHESAI